jgi:hypothetical protein
VTTEDKKAEKAARKSAEAEAHQREGEAKRLAEFEARFWEAPYGQARSAKLAGDRYFQIEIPLDWTTRSGRMSVTGSKHSGQGRTLTDIEAEGWELIQAGFVFKETGQISRDKFLSSGQQVNTTGETWGIYLFRATDAPARTDQVWLTWAAQNQAARDSAATPPVIPGSPAAASAPPGDHAVS